MNGSLKIIIGSALFALIPISIALSPGSSVFSLLLGRLVVAVFIIFLLYRKLLRNERIVRGQRGLIFFWSLTMLAAMLAYFKSIQLCGMGLSSMLLGTQPVFIFILSILFFSQKIRLISFLAVLLCSLGIFLVSIRDGVNEVYSFFGVFLAILTALLLALNFSIKKKFLNSYDSMYLIFIQSLVQLPFLFFLVDWSELTLSSNYLTASLLLGAICTVMSYKLIYDGITGTNSQLIGVYQSTEYVIPMFIGVLFFEENYTMIQWLGCGIILFATLSIELLSGKTSTIENEQVKTHQPTLR